jgi:hypothetical protein
MIVRNQVAGSREWDASNESATSNPIIIARPHHRRSNDAVKCPARLGLTTITIIEIANRLISIIKGGVLECGGAHSCQTTTTTG